MPTRETAPNGAPCWVDLMTSDVDRARTFYGELFGWEADEPNPEFGGYFNFAKDGVLIAGGMGAMPDAGPPDIWSIYLATDDAEKTVEVAAANGGQTLAPAMAIQDLGTMAVILDNTGAAIGMWQPGTFNGAGALGEPNTPAWFELLTRDYEGAIEFYRTVFGWDTRPHDETGEFRYTSAMNGEEPLAGIMDATGFLPEGVPAHWSVYFAVADADAACARVTELGGSIDRPPEDTPYGRLATVADPMGARFKLVQLPQG